jgi:5-methylcytosine-specific restriction endonuclease McrA
MFPFTCLVLTPWFAPHQCVPWQKAISMAWTHELNVLEQYAEAASSLSITIRFPAVAQLTKRLVSMKKDLKFSRANVYARDGYRCQYCGAKPPVKGLNYDHVVPRSKGGKTNWENIVTSCLTCNLKKGDKTLAQAGMTLRKKPVRPHSLPMSSSPLTLPAKVPELWLPYLHDRMASIAIAG